VSIAVTFSLFISLPLLTGFSFFGSTLAGSVFDLLHKDAKRKIVFKQRMKFAKDACLGMNWLHLSNPPILYVHNSLSLSSLCSVRDRLTQLLLLITCARQALGSQDSKSSGGSELGGKGLRFRSFEVRRTPDSGSPRSPQQQRLTELPASVTEHRVKKADKNKGATGSPVYMAPEVLADKAYDEKADVYSFAVVLWELVTNKKPYEEEQFESLDGTHTLLMLSPLDDRSRLL
jgi:serine/threonine protein kinase